MAHFALLDEHSSVVWVIYIANDATETDDGVEDESIGAAFCIQHVRDGRWVQTSYNGRIRRRFAGLGMTYSAEHDAFILPKPFTSWVLDLDDPNDWVAPIPQPSDPCENGVWLWKEGDESWVCTPMVTPEQP